MFDPLAFASSSALEAAPVDRCGCGCTGVVGVLVDDWIIVAY
jgi:hypothetical protein